MSAYTEIQRRFRKRPAVQVFSPSEYRVTVDGWQVHNGAATSRPCGDGVTLEKACAALLRYVDAPASWMHDGQCDHVCHAKYSRMTDKQAVVRSQFRNAIEEAANQVASWPAWKRGLPPCVLESCEREYEHAGKHRRAKPVEYEEWE